MFTKIVIITNLIFVIIIIILEHKKPQSFIFWSIISLFLPILGFILYVFLASKLKFRAKKLLLNLNKSTKNYLKQTSWYSNYVKTEFEVLSNKKLSIAKYNKKTVNCDLWKCDEIKYFYNGESFFNDLLKAIHSAKKFINLEFYIFSDDKIGKQLAKILCEKARQGVEVNLIYDSIGSRKTSAKFWNKLKKSGVNIYAFFTSPFNSLILNVKLNYRNHRKIVVIDGGLAYTGGINIRADHMNMHKKLKPWRDTQIKLKGEVVYALQQIFLNDLSYVKGSEFSSSEINNYFPLCDNFQGKQFMQVVYGGPEYENSKIYEVYINIIQKAEKYIHIQTPYFIIDKKMEAKLIDAKNRGVDVKILIPKKPDKKIVHMGTILSLKELIKNNIEIYLYNGFIHAKTLLTENVLSVGSVNFDNRSFYLNFEDTCLIYNEKEINKNYAVFNKDLQFSTFLSKKTYKKLKSNNIFKIIIFKLIKNFL